MGKIRDTIQRLNVLTPQVQEEALLQILRNNAAIIVDANIEQMMHGVDAMDQALEEYASQKYAEMKKKLNPLGVTDLHLTGDFQAGMFLEAEKFPATIDSKDEKTAELKGHYGEHIFGLGQKSLLSIIASDIKPDFQDYNRKAILGL